MDGPIGRDANAMDQMFGCEASPHFFQMRDFEYRTTIIWIVQIYWNKYSLFRKILEAFTYATRQISDDGALALIELFAEIVGVLIEIGDNHENWPLRLAWLNSLMAELWQNRGLYPGLLRVLDYLKFSEGIDFARKQISLKSEQVVKDQLFALLRGEANSIADLTIAPERIIAIRKNGELIKRRPKQLELMLFPASIYELTKSRELSSIRNMLAL